MTRQVPRHVNSLLLDAHEQRGDQGDMQNSVPSNVTRPRKTERQRKTSSERMKRLWADPEYRAMRSRRASEVMARLRQDPAFLQKRLDGVKRAGRTEEFRARMSEHFKAYYAVPENRERLAQCRREMMADPEKRAEWAGYCERGIIERCGIFYCPPELKPLYAKLRKHLGYKAARDEMRRLMTEQFAEKANYREAA